MANTAEGAKVNSTTIPKTRREIDTWGSVVHNCTLLPYPFLCLHVLFLLLDSYIFFNFSSIVHADHRCLSYLHTY